MITNFTNKRWAKQNSSAKSSKTSLIDPTFENQNKTKKKEIEVYIKELNKDLLQIKSHVDIHVSFEVVSYSQTENTLKKQEEKRYEATIDASYGKVHVDKERYKNI